MSSLPTSFPSHEAPVALVDRVATDHPCGYRGDLFDGLDGLVSRSSCVGRVGNSIGRSGLEFSAEYSV